MPFKRWTQLRKSNNKKLKHSLRIALILVILGGSFIFFVNVFQLKQYKVPDISGFLPFINKPFDLNGFLIKTNGCSIPDIEVLSSWRKEISSQEPTVTCNDGLPPLVESNLTHLYLLQTSFPAYEIENYDALECCYSAFRREIPKVNEPDTQVIINEECIPFNGTCKINDEYLRIMCWYNDSEIYKDFFAFVPIKKKVKVLTKESSFPVVNVLVVGIQGISRLNFHRQMPKTVLILKKIGAIEFFGYSNMANNTFSNVIPILTGLTEHELIKNCWPSRFSRFDDCPFIWKEFSKNGYSTVFAEDAPHIGIFNLNKMGFGTQPTDYLWGSFNYLSENEIGNEYDSNSYQCLGSKYTHKTLIEYMEKFAVTMNTNKISYFSFFWSNSLSQKITKPKLGDNDYANFLDNLRIKGLLDNTVLIFMSDYGLHYDQMHNDEVLQIHQSIMEERLSLLYVSLPEEYKKKYTQVFINLKQNSRKLTTPFDLYETLKDLKNPFSLTNETLNMRILEKKKGYSLFEFIPLNRNCEDAGIKQSWCTCQQIVNVNKNHPIVNETAQFVVDYINNILKKHPTCAHVSLIEVFNVRLHAFDIAIHDTSIQHYTVVFRTSPSDAMFEAVVKVHQTNGIYYFDNVVSNKKINLYGYQSTCVTDPLANFYCYCKL